MLTEGIPGNILKNAPSALHRENSAFADELSKFV